MYTKGEPGKNQKLLCPLVDFVLKQFRHYELSYLQAG